MALRSRQTSGVAVNLILNLWLWLFNSITVSTVVYQNDNHDDRQCSLYSLSVIVLLILILI